MCITFPAGGARKGEDRRMSRLFGDMRQVGIVVRDIEAAMRH